MELKKTYIPPRCRIVKEMDNEGYMATNISQFDFATTEGYANENEFDDFDPFNSGDELNWDQFKK